MEGSHLCGEHTELSLSCVRFIPGVSASRWFAINDLKWLKLLHPLQKITTEEIRSFVQCQKEFSRFNLKFLSHTRKFWWFLTNSVRGKGLSLGSLAFICFKSWQLFLLACFSWWRRCISLNRKWMCFIGGLPWACPPFCQRLSYFSDHKIWESSFNKKKFPHNVFCVI